MNDCDYSLLAFLQAQPLLANLQTEEALRTLKAQQDQQLLSVWQKWPRSESEIAATILAELGSAYE